jgi:general secretion pathway protein G
MRRHSGFSLIEIVVALAIMSILAGAIVPVVFRQTTQARVQNAQKEAQAIYEAMMGTPSQNYFGYVGDMGKLPDSIPQLMKVAGQGSAWNGPYLALGSDIAALDPLGKPYQIDRHPIRVRSFGPNMTDNHGAGDDIFYPENGLDTF